jgi:hypothetical protein
MGRLKTILVLAVIAVSALLIWQVGSVEIANLLFQGDMRELSLQVGIAATYSSPHTDEEFRAAVIKKARDHGIDLRPEQVTVRRSDEGGNAPMFLSADYVATVDLPRYSFQIHFTPASNKQAF